MLESKIRFHKLCAYLSPILVVATVFDKSLIIRLDKSRACYFLCSYSIKVMHILCSIYYIAYNMWQFGPYYLSDEDFIRWRAFRLNEEFPYHLLFLWRLFNYEYRSQNWPKRFLDSKNSYPKLARRYWYCRSHHHQSTTRFRLDVCWNGRI